MNRHQPLAEAPREALAESCRARSSVRVPLLEGEHDGDAFARECLSGQALERIGQNVIAFEIRRDKHQVA